MAFSKSHTANVCIRNGARVWKAHRRDIQSETVQTAQSQLIQYNKHQKNCNPSAVHHIANRQMFKCVKPVSG